RTSRKETPVADQYTIQVEHDGRSFHAGIRPDQQVDQLLARSLEFFEVDPRTKGNWTLVRAPRERRAEVERLRLRHRVADQLRDGERVRLLPRSADRTEPTTGT